MEPNLWLIYVKFCNYHVQRRKGKIKNISYFITKHRVQTTSGASPRKFLWGGYVNLGTFILDNIRTLVKALQKQSSWKLVPW